MLCQFNLGVKGTFGCLRNLLQCDQGGSNLKEKNIYFIPDENLGPLCGKAASEKNFIFNDGFCHVHKSIHADELLKAKAAHPKAEVLTHPECTGDVLELSDFIGSTSQIIDYATQSEAQEFIICTEMGVFYELGQKNPQKRFIPWDTVSFCPNMRRLHSKRSKRHWRHCSRR